MDAETTRNVDGCRRAQLTLDGLLDGFADEDMRRPSRLPGWTIGHLLTHLARNADSVTRRLLGAAADEVLDQYVGGATGRAADIDRGAGRSAADIVADVRRTSAAVDQVCAELSDEAWSRMTRNMSGALQPATHVVFARWREVEVHLVDLGVGYGCERWPDELVQSWLPDVLAGLPDRADPALLLGWALGRADAPALADWG